MIEVFKGNNSDNITIIADNFTFNDAGWYANLYVINKTTNAVVIGPKAMIKTSDGKQFYTQLDPEETASLNIDTYILAIKIWNNTLKFKKDIYDELMVKRSYIQD